MCFQHCSSAEKYRRWVWPRRSPWWAKASPFWLCLRAQSHQIGRASPGFNCKCAAGGTAVFHSVPSTLSFSPIIFSNRCNIQTSSLCSGSIQSSSALGVRVHCGRSTVCLSQKHQLSVAPGRKTLIVWSWQGKLYVRDGLWSALSQCCEEGMQELCPDSYYML